MAFGEGEDGIIATEADIFARVPFSATLADDDIAWDDVFAAKFFDAETFAVAVTSVFNGALSFLVGHGGVGW